MKRGYFFILCLVNFLVGQWAYPQEDKLGTKVIDIIKPYTPTISNAFKEAPLPSGKDTISINKQRVEYTIHSVPVASVYVPDKGQAMPLKHSPMQGSYDSFVALGAGMHTTLLGAAYLHYPLDKNTEMSLSLGYHSSQVGVKTAPTESNFADTQGRFNFKKLTENYGLNTSFGVSNELLHWYGVENKYFFPLIEHRPLRQSYTRANLSGGVEFYPTIFKEMQISLGFLKDYYGNMELNFAVFPQYQFDFGGRHRVKADLGIEYVRGKFDRTYYSSAALKHRNILLQGRALYQWSNDIFGIDAGLFTAYFSDKNEAISDNYFKFFPHANLTYLGIGKRIVPFLGVKATPKLNSFDVFTKENPFVSPTLEIRSTLSYKGYVGLKGNVSEVLHYEGDVFYERLLNEAFFTTNMGYQLPLKSHHFDNSFKVLYDETTIYGMSLGVNVNYFDKLTLFSKIRYQFYQTNTLAQPWNKPTFSIQLGGNYNLLPNWAMGINAIYMGSRAELSHIFPRKELTLSGFLDLNLHTDYTFARRWSIFLLLNNITGQQYERWAYYPFQGFGLHAGLKYQFNINKK